MNDWQLKSLEVNRFRGPTIGTKPEVPGPGIRLESFTSMEKQLTKLFEPWLDNKIVPFAGALAETIVTVMVIANSYGLSECLDSLVMKTMESRGEGKSLSISDIEAIVFGVPNNPAEACENDTMCA